MKNVFSAKSFWFVMPALVTLIVIKLAWVAAQWLLPLPTQGVEHAGTQVRHALHYRYRLASDTQLKAPVKSSTPKPKPKPKGSLSGYKLVGIYSSTHEAIVTLMRGAKSYVLSSTNKKNTVEGYRLKDANATAAHFQKNSEIVTLTLFSKPLPASTTAAPGKKPEQKPDGPVKKKPKKDTLIVEQGDTRVVDRSLIDEYTQNPDKIWKNIGLHEVKKEGKLDGFKVRFVRRGSPFEKLGLKRGDVIKSINGEPIVDYAGPMGMLKSADTIDDLSLTIERKHEEQELKYEIK
jgi:general secretion pathway protein C